MRHTQNRFRLGSITANLICCVGLAGLATAQPGLVHQWTFNGHARDLVGGAHGTLVGGAKIEGGRLVLDGINDYMASGPLAKTITERTLVVWVSLDNLTQRSGSALTIEDPRGYDRFDAIVYGERTPGQWMAGSNNFKRSLVNNGGAKETSLREVMLAIVYEKEQIDRGIFLSIFAARTEQEREGVRHLPSRGAVTMRR